MDIFGGLLDRPIIWRIFESNYPKLVTMMDEELNSAKLIYDAQMVTISLEGVPPVHKNFPKVGLFLVCRNFSQLLEFRVCYVEIVT